MNRTRSRSAVVAGGGHLIVMLLAAVAGAGTAVPEAILLVRHAETTPDGSADPALSPAGLARAERLAVMAGGLGLTSLYSSPYRRTRGTAAAVAAATGLALRDYDPRALHDLADRLLAAPGRHLVVGHSNTTPALVALLGGDPGEPIPEDEYGRVYLLVPTEAGMRTFVFRY